MLTSLALPSVITAGVEGADAGTLVEPIIGTLLGFLGGVAVYEGSRVISTLFPSDNSVINPVNLSYSEDTQTTKNVINTPLFDYVSYNKVNEKDDELSNYNLSNSSERLKVLNKYAFSLSSDKSLSNDVDLSSVLKSVDLSDVKSDDTLIDVMKSNNKSLIKVLSVLNNTISSGVVSSAYVGKQVNISLSNLYTVLNNLLKILAVGFSSGLIINNESLNKFFDYIKLNGLNVNNLSIENSLQKVADAKILEKENFEYMKTPRTYDFISDTIPSLSPRDVIALSEAVKAHLNSQEAELSGDELSDFEDDFNSSDVITNLFKFIGISNDIKNLPKE